MASSRSRFSSAGNPVQSDSEGRIEFSVGTRLETRLGCPSRPSEAQRGSTKLIHRDSQEITPCPKICRVVANIHLAGQTAPSFHPTTGHP